jgi:hypothetical protein
VIWEAAPGHWEERYLDATFPYLRHLADIQTELEVRSQGQKRARVQKVSVQLFLKMSANATNLYRSLSAAGLGDTAFRSGSAYVFYRQS